MLELNAKNFTKEVREEKNCPVIVDFWAPWCGPCRSQTPILEQLDREYNGAVKVCKLNVDDNRDLAGEFGVMSIPTIILFKNGEPLKKTVGLQNLANLKNLISNS